MKDYIIADPWDCGYAIPDGRLTAETSGQRYRFLDMVKLREKLGRELTPEEMDSFKIEEAAKEKVS